MNRHYCKEEGAVEITFGLPSACDQDWVIDWEIKEDTLFAPAGAGVFAFKLNGVIQVTSTHGPEVWR